MIRILLEMMEHRGDFMDLVLEDWRELCVSFPKLKANLIFPEITWLLNYFTCVCVIVP